VNWDQKRMKIEREKKTNLELVFRMIVEKKVDDMINLLMKFTSSALNQLVSRM
jgi:hypothetical protein